MSQDSDSLSYEQAKSALEEIVAKLEDPNLPLDDMVSLWEQGERYAKMCEEILTGARARIEALKPSSDLSE